MRRSGRRSWPRFRDCNIRNYTIFLREPENLLFAYWEYHGEDWTIDAAKMAADPRTRDWWAFTDPMQAPLATRKEGEWWAMAEEVFHHRLQAKFRSSKPTIEMHKLNPRPRRSGNFLSARRRARQEF